MATISSLLWSLFLATRRNSSSLIHIKLDNTSFLMGLVYLKTNRVHIFLCYFWFKSFPVLLLVLFFIFGFKFILVLFNLGFWWSFTGAFQIEENKTIRTPCEFFVGHVKFINHFVWCANFCTLYKPNSHTQRNFRKLCEIISITMLNFHRPCEINSHTLRNFRRPCEKIRTTKAISHTMRKPRGAYETQVITTQKVLFDSL